MPRPHVFVTRRIPAAALDILRTACEVHTWDHEEEPVPHEELVRRLQMADGALVVGPHRIDGPLMDAAPRCRIYANMAVGYDNIDLPEATRRKIMVTNTPGVLTETTADLAFGLMIAAARRLYEGQRTIVEGRWKGWSPLFMTGQDVYGATLGLVGAGRIGQAVARRARGFGMRILYHNRRPNPEFEAELGAEYRPLDDLLREADFVVLLVPLTPETRGLIGARELGLMKPTAVLVNAARGPVVEERALYEALRSRQIFAAGLDVFDQEPIPPDHPLLTLPNVTAVPHIGSATVKTRTRMAVLAAENLVAGVAGRRPSNLVNPEVFGR